MGDIRWIHCTNMARHVIDRVRPWCSGPHEQHKHRSSHRWKQIVPGICWLNWSLHAFQACLLHKPPWTWKAHAFQLTMFTVIQCSELPDFCSFRYCNKALRSTHKVGELLNSSCKHAFYIIMLQRSMRKQIQLMGVSTPSTNHLTLTQSML